MKLILIISSIASLLISSESFLISEDGLIGKFNVNAVNKPSPTIIALGGSDGGMPFEYMTWTGVQERGYNVLQLAYFDYEGLPPSLNNIPLEYFEKAFKWLSKQKSVVKDNYHLMGISKGAELSLLLASHYDEIKGVFAMVPSSVVWQGIPKGMYTGTNSSWTHKDKEIPYVPFGTFDFISLGKGIIYNEWIDYYDNALANAEESSFIKVENIDAPIILISGKHDQIWPSEKMCNQIIDRLEKNNFKYDFEHIALDTDHFLFSSDEEIIDIIVTKLRDFFN